MQKELKLNAFQFELLLRAEQGLQLAQRECEIARAAVLAGFDIDFADVLALDPVRQTLIVALPEESISVRLPDPVTDLEC